MDLRNYYENLKRLKAMALETDLTGDQVSKLIGPFIDEWRTVATPNRADGTAMPTILLFNPNRLQDIAVRVKTIGMNLVKARLGGIRFHNAFQLHVCTLAGHFDCHGWTESAATFMDPEVPDPVNTTQGRIDVIWASNRIPVAIFEIDSTVKLRSFQKLKEAAAPHKFWVYFGKDVWGFKSLLLKEDPEREIVPIIIPNSFTPSFGDPARGVAPMLPPVMDN